jgi:hypothetical protein
MVVWGGGNGGSYLNSGGLLVISDILDQDLDGYPVCAGDCDDTNPGIYPGAPQLCDGHNNDCSDPTWPALPPNEADADSDGYSVCTGDCNETSPAVHPGAPDVCNGVDDNCNGLIDEDPAGTDSDNDGIHNACDNCRFAFNPTQQDTDSDGIGNVCDNCITVTNAAQTDLDGDQRGDVCDNCASDYNPSQDDFDSDSAGDACDNCLSDPNRDQSDFDHDAQGDVCDLNDGLILVSLGDSSLVTWQLEEGFQAFNEYRGDLAVLRQSGVYAQDPATTPLAERNCNVFDSWVGAGLNPGVGQAVFYLVTGLAGGTEGSLGTNSAGAPRSNTNPCP